MVQKSVKFSYCLHLNKNKTGNFIVKWRLLHPQVFTSVWRLLMSMNGCVKAMWFKLLKVSKNVIIQESIPCRIQSSSSDETGKMHRLKLSWITMHAIALNLLVSLMLITTLIPIMTLTILFLYNTDYFVSDKNLAKEMEKQIPLLHTLRRKY